MSLNPPKPRLITSTWGGKCSECQLPVAQGDTCWFTPPFLHKKGSIKHLDGQCGSVYVVIAIFRSSRTPFKVPAFSAEEALEKIRKSFEKPRRCSRCAEKSPYFATLCNSCRHPFQALTKAQPLEWHVTQGNFVVLRRFANGAETA